MKPTIPDPKTIRSENVFFCVTCESKQKMTLEETKAHLKEKHNIEQTIGSRTMLSHLDGKDWYNSTYEWTVSSPTGKVKLVQSKTDIRSQKDPMRFE